VRADPECFVRRVCEVREYYDGKESLRDHESIRSSGRDRLEPASFFFQGVRQFAFVEFFIAQIKKQSIYNEMIF